MLQQLWPAPRGDDDVVKRVIAGGLRRAVIRLGRERRSSLRLRARCAERQDSGCEQRNATRKNCESPLSRELKAQLHGLDPFARKVSCKFGPDALETGLAAKRGECGLIGDIRQVRAVAVGPPSPYGPLKR